MVGRHPWQRSGLGSPPEWWLVCGEQRCRVFSPSAQRAASRSWPLASTLSGSKSAGVSACSPATPPMPRAISDRLAGSRGKRHGCHTEQRRARASCGYQMSEPSACQPRGGVPAMSRGTRTVLGLIGGAVAVAIGAVIVVVVNRPAVPSAMDDELGEPPSETSTTTGPPDSSAVARAPTAGPWPSNQRANAGDATHPGDGVWVMATAAREPRHRQRHLRDTPPGRFAQMQREPAGPEPHHHRHRPCDARSAATVTVLAGVALFNTKGCGEWRRVG